MGLSDDEDEDPYGNLASKKRKAGVTLMTEFLNTTKDHRIYGLAKADTVISSSGKVMPKPPPEKGRKLFDSLKTKDERSRAKYRDFKWKNEQLMRNERDFTGGAMRTSSFSPTSLPISKKGKKKEEEEGEDLFSQTGSKEEPVIRRNPMKMEKGVKEVKVTEKGFWLGKSEKDKEKEEGEGEEGEGEGEGEEGEKEEGEIEEEKGKGLFDKVFGDDSEEDEEDAQFCFFSLFPAFIVPYYAHAITHHHSSPSIAFLAHIWPVLFLFVPWIQRKRTVIGKG